MINNRKYVLLISLVFIFAISASVVSAGSVETTESIAGGAWADSTLSNARGWNITIQVAMSNSTTTNIIKITKEASSTATHAQIRTANNAVTIATAKFNDGFGLHVAQFPVAIGLIPDNYRFLCSNNGTNYNARRLTGEALPQDTGAINWIEGANENLDDDGFCIQSITYLESSNDVNLTYPSNNSGFISLVGQTFNATFSPLSDSVTAVNATRYLYNNAGTLISTNFTTSVANNKTNFTIPSLADGTYRWNVLGGFSNGESKFAPANFTFSIDSTSPTVNGALPVNNSYIYSLNSTFTQFILNITATDSIGVGSVWYNSTWDSTIRLVANAANTIVNLTNVFGKHQIYRFANDSAGNLAMNQTTIWIHRNIFSNETYETDVDIISLELWNLSQAPTSPVLAYNGTNFTPTITNMGNGKYSLNTTLDIALGSGNRSFQHYYNDGTARVSPSLNQSVSLINFSMCTGTTPPKYLNISFKNETVAQEVVNASIASSLFTYWLGSGDVSKNYSFSTATEQRNYTFCFTPGHKTLNVLESVSYANSLSAQRTYSATISLTNATTQQTLYLLPNSLGIYVTFQIINPALQPIEGVSVNISSSTFGPIETKMTDASGAATFFLNPLINYNIVATKAGLPTYTTSLTPTQTDYTITMGVSSTNTTVQDYFRGIVYSIGPSGTYLTNGTDYVFNFTISSDFWNLDRFGFSIRNASGSQFGSNISMVSSGGTVSLNRNVGRNTTIIVDAYWVIQGNTTNVSKTFTIFDSSGSGTSLANLRDRITLYIQNGGFFGLTPFGLNIIVFLIIFSVTGLASWKFGFTSPVAVFALMFAVTMVFDIMNLITYAEALPDGAASLMTGILTLAFAIREAFS